MTEAENDGVPRQRVNLRDVVFREVNLRIHSLAAAVGTGGAGEYFCECGSDTCEMTTIPLESTVFADILALDGAILVVPSHQPAGNEILRAGEGYAVVEPGSRRGSAGSLPA